MKSIDRYILHHLGLTGLFVTVTLTFAIWLTQSLRLFDFIVNRNLPADKFLAFAGLLLPSFLGVVLPIAAFVAVLFVYNKLISDSELVVLRAAGLSQMQLARAGLLLGLVVTLMSYAISLYFLPTSFRAFKDLQWEIRNDYSTTLLQEGVFAEVDKGVTVYVRARNEKGELLGLMVHDNRDPDRPVTMMAKRGALVRGENGPVVVMVQGNRQELERESGRLSFLNFDRYNVEIGGLTGDGGAAWRWHKPKERFLPELLWPGDEGRDLSQRNELISEGHQRIVGPLYGMVFVLIGLAALLAGEFSRRGQTKRILIAIACVGLLEGAMVGAQGLAVLSLNLVPLMYVLPILPGLVALRILAGYPRRGRRQSELPAGA
jgi:lipopolysaccharide export system permease protein